MQNSLIVAECLPVIHAVGRADQEADRRSDPEQKCKRKDKKWKREEKKCRESILPDNKKDQVRRKNSKQPKRPGQLAPRTVI